MTNPQQNKENQDTTSLRGTFASVLILGVFIALSWASVFYLFLERN